MGWAGKGIERKRGGSFAAVCGIAKTTELHG
jgi:hypothetical protein